MLYTLIESSDQLREVSILFLIYKRGIVLAHLVGGGAGGDAVFDYCYW